MPYSSKEKRNQLTLNYYHNHKAAYKERATARRKQARDYILAIKKRSKCATCGESHPATLDFHHRDPTDKEICANHMIKHKWSPERIDKELEKCDVLCANCHRKFHWAEDKL